MALYSPYLSLSAGISLLAFCDLSQAQTLQFFSATAVQSIESEQEIAEEKDSLGITWKSDDGRFLINPWLRLQTRYSNPFDSDPLQFSDYEDSPGDEFEVRRARIKTEGHIFSPNIGFYYEQELSGDHPLLDLRLDISLRDDLLLRIGQYKLVYNRERIDSSGKQQFVERSISTYAFTLDRQRGVSLAKHFSEGTRWDNWLILAVLEGDSRDPQQKGDDPMLVGRWQWHFLGEPLGYSQSDIKFTAKPAATLSLGYSQVQGPYTRFSSSGGGQLDGFSGGGDNRYELQQWLVEFAYKFNGYSIQQEYHRKDIDDHEGNEDGQLTGGYFQFGKMIQLSPIPFPLELAARYAKVDWDTHQARTQQEFTLAMNVFFSGHDNKFTIDVSRVELDMSEMSEADIRVRAQWDFSF